MRPMPVFVLQPSFSCVGEKIPSLPRQLFSCLQCFIRQGNIQYTLSSIGIGPYSLHCERRHAMSEPNTTNSSKTDWARVDAMRDEDIDLSDSAELDARFLLTPF
jgi:hypothetical protein